MRPLLPLLLAALLCVPVALADSAPIENTPDLPWTNPDHTSNLEVLLGQIASQIAGRTVTARCEGETDWGNLAAVGNFDPKLEFGYVNAFKDHVNVGFFFGALLNDPAGLLEGTGKRGRHVKLWPGRGVDSAALVQLVDAAYVDMRSRLGK